ncbi:MAG: single-stranded-DNA-specific exonuclease RecJ [Planctomycetota bacterium]
MRLPEPRWVVSPIPTSALEEDIPALARSLGVPALVARLLWLRDLRDPETARAFLSPRLADLRPPDRLPDTGEAAERLARAVRAGERIAVFGDYDVDGMTGTALLVRFFRLAGADVVWAIPDRDADGYGLGVGAVERLAREGAHVIVTVDNGVAAHEAVERAVALGLEVVITDHHLPGPSLPPARAIVNPHRLDGSGEGRHLCGCALAFKVAWAVAERLRHVIGSDGAERYRAFLRDAMGLVALATVSDVVPLTGENRILVSGGLASLRQSRHPGIRALLESARVGSLPLTTEDVAFRIGPRINAAGRLSRPELVIELLTAEDPEEARRLARRLEEANVERRRIEKGVLAEATVQAEDRLAETRGRSLVVHGDGWHRGVIGIIASRLVDLHHRPTVVIGFSGSEGRGSCRTVAPVNLHDALTRCDAHLSRYGGHAAAAGLEITRGEVDAFARTFEEAVRDQLGRETPVRTLRIDAESDVDDWTLETTEAVGRLDPFGAENPEPVFLIRGAEVAGRARIMGKDGAHLSFALKRSGGAVRVVGFRRAELHDLAASGRPLDLVVTPVVNEWRGMRTAELRLVDMRAHDGSHQPS